MCQVLTGNNSARGDMMQKGDAPFGLTTWKRAVGGLEGDRSQG